VSGGVVWCGVDICEEGFWRCLDGDGGRFGEFGEAVGWVGYGCVFVWVGVVLEPATCSPTSATLVLYDLRRYEYW